MEYMTRWYDESNDDSVTVASRVFETVGIIDAEYGTTRRERLVAWLKLYENRELQGLLPGEYVPDSEPLDLVLNACAAANDTLDSKISTVKPKPQFLTQGGAFSEQQQAKAMQYGVMGCFTGEKIYAKGMECARDCKVGDIGIMKVYMEDKTARYERVPPEEIIVDELAATSAPPRELFQRKFVPTDLLAAQYPKYKQQIYEALAPNLRRNSRYSALITEVVEGWHLPSGKKSKDGRHVICVVNCTLLDEKWTKDDFPFVFLRWNKRSKGFFGQGLIEQVEGLQRELNEVTGKIQDAHALLGIPWIVEPETAQVGEGKLTNRLGERIKYSGQQAPTVQVHAVLAPEVYRYQEFCFQKIFELTGVSVLSASSKLPAGLNQPSGVALRTYLDTETQRFALFVEAWKEFYLELARKTVELLRETKGVKIKYAEKHFAKEIEWDEIDLGEDRYLLQLWPVNLLPDTPTGKLAYVETMITMGVIGPDVGRALLDYPDIEAYNSLTTAAYDDALAIIEHFQAGGEYIEPLEWEQLDLCIGLMQGAYLRCRINGAPEGVLENMARWLKEAGDLAAAAKAAANAPPPPKPGQSQGAELQVGTEGMTGPTMVGPNPEELAAQLQPPPM